MVRVAWALPRYPNRAPAGAEWTAHELLAELARRGHQSHAVIIGASRRTYQPTVFEGVHVSAVNGRAFDGGYDVVIGHLGHAADARAIAGRAPVVWMAHAEYQYAWGEQAKPDRWIANAEHVRIAGPAGTWLMRPHVPAARYHIAALEGVRPDAITLIGASDVKGISTLRRIARANPNRSFIVVQNAYDQQRISPGQHGNIWVFATQPDLRDIYRMTRVLLQPSLESWGRVAIEAAHNGIPTIAAAGSGILEALGDAATYADPRAIAEWSHRIAELDDPATYTAASTRARVRATELEQLTTTDRDQTIDHLVELACH